MGEIFVGLNVWVMNSSSAVWCKSSGCCDERGRFKRQLTACLKLMHSEEIGRPIISVSKWSTNIGMLFPRQRMIGAIAVKPHNKQRVRALSGTQGWWMNFERALQMFAIQQTQPITFESEYNTLRVEFHSYHNSLVLLFFLELHLRFPDQIDIHTTSPNSPQRRSESQSARNTWQEPREWPVLCSITANHNIADISTSRVLSTSSSKDDPFSTSQWRA